jgi:hypothetical protein
MEARSDWRPGEGVKGGTEFIMELLRRNGRDSAFGVAELHHATSAQHFLRDPAPPLLFAFNVAANDTGKHAAWQGVETLYLCIEPPIAATISSSDGVTNTDNP